MYYLDENNRTHEYAGSDPGLAIDATNFPDATFRSWISDKLDTEGDGYLSDEEIAAVTNITLSSDYGEVADLTGHGTENPELLEHSADGHRPVGLHDIRGAELF